MPFQGFESSDERGVNRLKSPVASSVTVVNFLYLNTNYSGMTRQAIIERTIKSINQLPEDKAEEIADFADFVTKRFEENRLTEGIQQMTANSQTFAFLNDEEDDYSEADLKEVYNG
jgi:hypothetical protein